MKVVFMGTTEFSAHALESLIYSKHQVLAVYTREPKPMGRRKVLTKTPIHILAEEHNIEVHTPKSFKNPDELKKLKSFKADVIIVAAYGVLLPKTVLESAKYSAINIHPSKLPRWRGAAPIERSMMAGDTETAVCIMQMDEGLDTGDILLQQLFPIPDCITARQFALSLGHEGAKMLLTALDKIERGDITRTKQSDQGVTYAQKIFKEDGLIDWTLDARLVNCHIRALSPKPGAYFMYHGTKIKIISADYDLTEVSAEPGTIIDDKLTIACGQGVIKPTLVQRLGREMLYTEAFLRGFSVHIDSKVGR